MHIVKEKEAVITSAESDTKVASSFLQKKAKMLNESGLNRSVLSFTIDNDYFNKK